MSVGENIRKYRKLAKLSQEDLAKATGLSVAAIQGYEYDKYAPKFENLKKLAKALDCSAGELTKDYLPWEFIQTLVESYVDVSTSLLGLQLIECFNELNEDGEKEAVKRIKELARLPEYTKPLE